MLKGVVQVLTVVTSFIVLHVHSVNGSRRAREYRPRFKFVFVPQYGLNLFVSNIFLYIAFLLTNAAAVGVLGRGWQPP